MCVEPDKPYMKIEEQIKLLLDRGLIIDNPQSAIKFITLIGYYPLINGYGKFYLNQDDHFTPGTKIEHIYAQYILDRGIQRIVLHRIIDCEDELKTALGHIISRDFGVWEKMPGENGYVPKTVSYLDPTHYRWHKNTIPTLSAIKERIHSTPHTPTSYYRNHKNHVPPWIAFRNIDFGHSINLFKSLKYPQKMEIIHRILPKTQLFTEEEQKKLVTDSFDLLRAFRNPSAHGSVLYRTVSHKAIPKSAAEKLLGADSVSSPQYKSSMGINDIYGLFLTLIIFNPSIEDSAKMISELAALQQPFISATNDLDMVTYQDFSRFSNIPINYVSKLKSAFEYFIN